VESSCFLFRLHRLTEGTRDRRMRAGEVARVLSNARDLHYAVTHLTELCMSKRRVILHGGHRAR